MLQDKVETVIPEWMKEQNNYLPAKDKNGFLTKTILNLLKLFRHFHVTKNESISKKHAGFRTILMLGSVILTAVSHNLLITGFVAAGFLLFLCFSKVEVIKKVLSASFAAALFTAIIMLPSFFIYKSLSVVIITIKVFLSVGIVSFYSNVTPWNKITAALRVIKIPVFIIFIIDLTIHYILILGNVAYEMLFALKLRSVGKNKNKQKSFSGILGTVFLKSVSIAEETQQAMECRLFDGTYSDD